MSSKEEKSFIKQEKMFDERNMFINEKNICDLSLFMISKFDNFLKTNLLKDTDLKIHIKIVNRATINAYAGFVGDDYKVAQILITQNMLIELYRWALTFTVYSKKFYQDSPQNIDDLNNFDLYKDSDFLFNDLPKFDLNKLDDFATIAVEAMKDKQKHDLVDANLQVSKTMFWQWTLVSVLSHEVSHLLQKHMKILKDMGYKSGQYYSEISTSTAFDNGQNLIPFRQSMELLADINGMMITLNYMFHNKQLTFNNVYMLLCGQACVFNQFYYDGTYSEQLNIFESTHPHPVIRMKFFEYFTYYVLEEIAFKNYDRVIFLKTCAYLGTKSNLLVGLYWKWRYLPDDIDGLTSFLNLSAEQGQQSACEYNIYIKKYIFELCDLIEKEYLGDSTPLLFIKSRMHDFFEKRNPS